MPDVHNADHATTTQKKSYWLAPMGLTSQGMRSHLARREISCAPCLKAWGVCELLYAAAGDLRFDLIAIVQWLKAIRGRECLPTQMRGKCEKQ